MRIKTISCAIWTFTIFRALLGIPATIFPFLVLLGKRKMKLLAGIFGLLTSLIGGILILVGNFKKTE